MARCVAANPIKRAVLEIVGRVPSGRVVTLGALGRHMRVTPHHIATILAGLGGSERDTVPWHRVVADGGAIGRHKHHDAQIARLKREGVPVSGAGIVQGLAERVIVDLDSPGGAAPAEPALDAAPKDRARGMARGMKGRPQSSTT